MLAVFTIWSWSGPGEIQLWLKLLYTSLACFILAVNWKQYGPGNLLWFSDVALLGTAFALWLESSLLASMMALAVILMDVIWNTEFFFRLIVGKPIIGLTGYMFDPKIPLRIRAISLFHIGLPILLLWMLHRLGYDRRAFIAQTLLALVVLPLSYLLTKPSMNVNWVFGLGEEPQKWMPPRLYLILTMILFPIIIYLPAHLVFEWIFL